MWLGWGWVGSNLGRKDKREEGEREDNGSHTLRGWYVSN